MAELGKQQAESGMKTKKRYQTYERKDGSVGYIVDTRNAEGRKVRRTFDRLQDADEFYEKLKRDRRRVGAGLDPLIEEIKLKDFADLWLQRRKAEGKPMSSWQADEQRVRRYIKPVFGYLPMSRIQTYQVEKFLGELIPKYGISMATRNKIRDTLSVMYRDAIRLRHAYKNPVVGTTKVKIIEEKWRIWNSEGDVDKFLKVASQDVAQWFFPLAYLMIHTGLRLGEALSLRWDVDINLDEGWIHVHQTYEKETKSVVERTKGKRARWVGLNDAAAEVLRAYRATRPRMHARSGAYVFCKDDGSIIRPRRAIIVQYRVCDRAEVTRIRLHDLRHQYASMFTRQKGNRFALQKLLGHSTGAMTDRYSHLDPTYLREQANVVQIPAPRVDSNATKSAQKQARTKLKEVKTLKNNKRLK